ncbi:uncharacterized protein MELLADRAFT_56986 [Melampsora larici-populina 98AG31]|uniref:Uncharacterized protein n=1 Tax=Melampsora larici-populina (strain 98AG31 / pathotype 3-4-7) TaxID=747676 RepID=F4RWZ5_MELLP|nr:uncharacterized protein MELLADRAFT_56986 [Melampsora larici-populina 98AG31]EGG03135.1 hypothetical protein MELLADRAFT_56986 [Melampsora larici-populina 98AG31]
MEKSLLEQIGQAEENATRMTRAQSAALERSRADTKEEGGSGNQIQEQNQGQDQQKESNTGEIGNSQQIKSINEEGQGAEVAGQQNSEDQQRRAEGDRNQEAQDGVDGIPFIQITNADESEDESWHPPTRSQKGKNRKLLSHSSLDIRYSYSAHTVQFSLYGNVTVEPRWKS